MLTGTIRNDTVTANGISGKNVPDLCRKLIEAGTPDGPMTLYRGTMPCLNVKRIGFMAGYSIVNEPYTRYVPFREFEKWEEPTEEQTHDR